MNQSLRTAALAAVCLLLLICATALAEPPIDPAVRNLSQAAGGILDDMAVQIGLERHGFSPGIIDGHWGQKTSMALHDFERVHGLIDENGKSNKNNPSPFTLMGIDSNYYITFTFYTITPADQADVAPAPKGWLEKSRLDRMRYASLEELVAEKFHTSRACLARLNPGLTLAALKVGDKLTVPNVTEEKTLPHADRIDINLSEKVIRLYAAGKEIALFHCSIAKDKAKLPSGDARVSVISTNPNYTFDPAHWPEVHNIDHKLLIPPGPRNPVGLCWVGLSLPGYGMHGTPTPELIGKTGSHGCFRLTNWDAVRLGRMVSVGTPVHFSAAASPVTIAAAN